MRKKHGIFTQILKKVGVKQEEEQLVKLCMLHALATGSIIPIIVSVPMALFLSKFGSAALSYGFIANALLTLVMGSIYVFFEKKLPFGKLQLGLVCCIVMLLFLSWLGVSIIGANWIVALVLILSWTIFDFAIFEFWCVLNRLFNLQQAKRLFGLIGALRAIAAIIIGFCSPLFIYLLGINQLLLIATITFMFAVTALYKIKKLYPKKMDQQDTDEQEDVEEEQDYELNIKKALKNEYFLAIFIFSILMMFINVNFDLLWNMVAAKHYPNQEELAKFFSIFSAVLAGSQLVFSFLSVPILKYYGVIQAIIFHSIVLLILGTVIFLSDWLLKADTAIFFTILVMYLFHVSYITSVRAPAILVLFQPLLQQDRSWIQGKLEALINPVATGVAGLIMVFLTSTLGISIKILMLPLLVLCSIFLLITYTLKSGYIAALTKALTKHYLVKPKLATLDKSLLPFLQQKMGSPFPEEVLFVLSSLEHIDKMEYQRALVKALESEHDPIRKYAIEQYIHYPHPTFLEKIRTLAIADASKDVRAMAYQILASSKKESDIQFVLKGLDSPDSNIRLSIIKGLFKYLDRHHAMAKKKLLYFLESELPENPKLAAQVIGDNRIEDLLPQLLILSKDKDPHVQGEAIISLGKMNHAAALSELLQTETIESRAGPIIKSLVAGGQRLIKNLTPLFIHLQSNAQLLIVRAISYMDDGPACQNLLLKNLNVDSLSVRFYVLSALIKKHYQAKDDEVKNIEHCITETLHLIEMFRKKIAMIPDKTSCLILKEFLERQVELAEERLFMLLSFIYDSSEIIKVRMGLKSQDADKVSYALEMLEVRLLPKHKADVLSIFTQPESFGDITSFNRLLEEILKNKDKIFDKWIIVATLYYVGENKLQWLLSLVTPYLSSSEKEIKETSEWAVNKLLH